MSILCKSDFVMVLVDVSHIYIVIHVYMFGVTFSTRESIILGRMVEDRYRIG